MPNDVNCKYYDPINGWCEKLSDFGYPKHLEYCPKSPCDHAEPIEQVVNDNDIIKAFECCKGEDIPCADCPYIDFGQCQTYVASDALDLINRLKAEIEKLQHICAELSKENEEQDRAIINALHRMKEIRNETVKEFAERLKGNCISVDTGDRSYKIITTIWIDNLAKEMTEGEDDPN